jgi:hypothetical protein
MMWPIGNLVLHTHVEIMTMYHHLTPIHNLLLYIQEIFYYSAMDLLLYIQGIFYYLAMDLLLSVEPLCSILLASFMSAANVGTL